MYSTPVKDTVPARLPVHGFTLAPSDQRELPVIDHVPMTLPVQSHPVRHSHSPTGFGPRSRPGEHQPKFKPEPKTTADRSLSKYRTSVCSGPALRNILPESNRRVYDTFRLLPADGKTVGTRQLIFIRTNVDGTDRTALKVVLSRRAVQTLGQVICEVSEAFGPKWSHDPIRHVYAVTGREIRSVVELFRPQKVFIATGMQRLFGTGRSTDRGLLAASQCSTLSNNNNSQQMDPIKGETLRVRSDKSAECFCLVLDVYKRM
ncbi:unnamed protein product [Echinostoma caproni]|uniref:Doublecortin domain-containing protein n=1 Tax=Echinostoma caproni TaxID=27848 RepID=A0A182ZZ86_9TREM|nr:unnamed protein product [Echinostoma caproni]